MKQTIGRGLAAGAAGVTALNAASFVDMLFRGRPGSEAPGRLVEELLSRAGIDIPGRGQEKANRRTALGAIAGMKAGLGVGIVAAAARSAKLRVPAPIGVALTGAAAMAAADVPLAKLNITDPSTWSSRDWAVDVAGHLAYGMSVQAVLHATEPPVDRNEKVRRRASLPLLGRSLMLGAATGSRSTLAFAGPVLAKKLGGRNKPSGRTAGLTAVALGSELLVDKLPMTPSRLGKSGLPPRFISAAGGAIVLARRDRSNAVLPVIASAVGAAAGSFGGAAWRDYAQQLGWTWQAGLVEDVLAVGLAAGASWPTSAKITA
ncbi:hypothetical protein [Arthrobacter roseus]|uniref:hypothetical protein n=1 Tax=Arthrobacter roseus TaxID=136274 RepID=UPI001965ECD8|nr:hypothetical protein [Arthrobacter roseus]MBM7847810.1 hypothetical protein [Arthrobacter roseus]